MEDEMTDREKCLVIQMMLRQSPKLKKLPEAYIKALHVFYLKNIYPSLTPKEVNSINLELTQFLNKAESRTKSGLMASIGKDTFNSLAKKFGFGKDTDEGVIDQEQLKEIESLIRRGKDTDDDS